MDAQVERPSRRSADSVQNFGGDVTTVDNGENARGESSVDNGAFQSCKYSQTAFQPAAIAIQPQSALRPV